MTAATQSGTTETVTTHVSSRTGLEVHLLYLMLVLVLAAAARVPFMWGTSFPLNDGGMFAQIVDDLRANHLALPRETTYNFEHIPLCYPPLGFYAGALWSAVFGQTSAQMMRWEPPLVSIICVLALYFLALEMLRRPFLAFCAAAIYAVWPYSAEWLSMGGGLTRSLGELFAIIALLLFVRGIRTDRISVAVAGGVAAGVTAMSHLEAGVFAALSMIVFTFLPFPSRRKFFMLSCAGTAAVVVVAPWVLERISELGTSPFAAAFGTRTGADSEVRVISFKATLVAGILALFGTIRRLPPYFAWFLLIMVGVPRSWQTHEGVILGVIGAWLVGYLFDFVSKRRWVAPRLLKQMVVAGSFLVCLAGAFWYVKRHDYPRDRLNNLIHNERATLSTEETGSMQWVRSNTPADARFFVFDTRAERWYADFVAEWFPYFAQRKSVYTAQGKEWLPKGAFQNDLKHIPNCDFVHTEQQLARYVNVNDFDYLVLAGPFDEDHGHCASLLRSAAAFQPVYQTANVLILRRQ